MKIAHVYGASASPFIFAAADTAAREIDPTKYHSTPPARRLSMSPESKARERLARLLDAGKVERPRDGSAECEIIWNSALAAPAGGSQ